MPYSDGEWILTDGFGPLSIKKEIDMARAEYKQDIKELVKEVEAFRKEFQKKGQKLLQNAFIQFFKENPTIKTLTWVQYTPYFNDGDECIFSVDDFYGCNKELTADDISSPYDLENYDESEEEDAPISFEWNSKEGKAIGQFAKMLKPLEDVFKELFDDHVWVIATKNGFEVNEYEHE